MKSRGCPERPDVVSGVRAAGASDQMMKKTVNFTRLPMNFATVLCLESLALQAVSIGASICD